MSYASEQGVLNGQWNAAEMAFQVEVQRARPFMLLRPALYPDGNKWCALYGENLQDGLAAFGDTPDEAAKAFDEAWFKQTCGLKAGGLAAELPAVSAANGAPHV